MNMLRRSLTFIPAILMILLSIVGIFGTIAYASEGIITTTTKELGSIKEQVRPFYESVNICDLAKDEPKLEEICSSQTSTTCSKTSVQILTTRILDPNTNLGSITTDCNRREILAIFGKKDQQGRIIEIDYAYLMRSDTPDLYTYIQFGDTGLPNKVILADETEISITGYDKNGSIRGEATLPNGKKTNLDNYRPILKPETIEALATVIREGERADQNYNYIENENSCIFSKNLGGTAEKSSTTEMKCAPPSYVQAVSLFVSGIGCALSLTGGILGVVLGCNSLLLQTINLILQANCKNPNVVLKNIQSISNVVGRALTIKDCLSIKILKSQTQCSLTLLSTVLEELLPEPNSHTEKTKKNTQKQQDETKVKNSIKDGINCGFKDWCKQQGGEFDGVSGHEDCWCHQVCTFRCHIATKISAQSLEQACNSQGGEFTGLDNKLLNIFASCVGPRGWDSYYMILGGEKTKMECKSYK